MLSNVVSASPLNPSPDFSLLHINSTITPDNRGVRCFRKMARDHPPARGDCLKVIDGMLQDDSLMKVRTWSAYSSTVLEDWLEKSCVIGVGVWESAGPDKKYEDRFTLWECVEKAQLIVQECLGKGMIGGRGDLGPKGVFQIVVKNPRETP